MTTDPGGEPQTYKIASPTAGGKRNCTFKGCQGRAVTRMKIQVHFLHRNYRDTVIILEEGNPPHPWCPWCDMLVQWKDLNRGHINTSHCAKGWGRKRRKLA